MPGLKQNDQKGLLPCVLLELVKSKRLADKYVRHLV